jgi:branched-chain amino acid transport system permease protein
VTSFLQHAVDAISLGGLYALIALGIALIFGVMGFINFAHGELIMVGGYVLVVMSPQPFAVAIVATLAAVVVTALLMERVAFRPLREASPLTLLITSFALGLFLQSLARTTVGTVPRSVTLPDWISGSIDVGGVAMSKVAVAEIVVSLVLLSGLWLLLKKTDIGIQMRASAESFTTARLLGVHANRVIAISFAISGFLAGMVSLLFVAQIGVVTPTMGLGPALAGFVATVVGGMRSLGGAVLGGFLLGILTVSMDVVLPADMRSSRDAFVFGIVIVILLLRPEGLLGRRLERV